MTYYKALCCGLCDTILENLITSKMPLKELYSHGGHIVHRQQILYPSLELKYLGTSSQSLGTQHGRRVSRPIVWKIPLTDKNCRATHKAIQ